MKFFVLASNSFTGSHFVDHVLKNTDAEVVGISRSPEYNPVLLPYLYRKEKSKRFTFYQLDVNNNLPDILGLVDRFKPDYVMNYSAQGEVRNSWKWPEQWYETNCMAVVRLTSELVKRDFIKKYVASSTPEVYGTTGTLIQENHTYQPSTPYAGSKLAGDLHLMTLFKRYGFPVNLTRAANLYGIHQQLYRIIPRTVIYVKSGKKIQLHGRGLAVRSFIHARDVAESTFKVCTQAQAGEVYHLAPQNESFTIAQVVKMICDKMRVKFEEATEMMDENFGQDALFSMSAEKIRKDLAWSPQVSFEDGVNEVIEWIESNWEVVKNLPHDYVHLP